VAKPSPGPAAPRPTLEGERRPLVTFSDNADKAWAAKIKRDSPQPAARQSRVPITAAAMAALAFLAVFLGGREAAVTALPDLASLYEALGMPVNLDGIAIEDVTAERAPGLSGSVIAVSGKIRNVSGTAQNVPQLVAILYDSAKVAAGSRSFAAPAATIAVNEQAPFLLKLENVPPQAVEVVVRFRRPGEDLPTPSDPSAPAQ
jgi:hypothetical protein